ncbi:MULTISPECIES: hypothetical protein [Streptomycetaceae]|uniref:Uncharacterized protein n=1 Tax=Streptantibioticus cattleyicolor (strain ATCC 35852 / DSM 46488 / JCM 4925 / NBRC 14057 / NRRL 8057) TaxID=1003195 RepID=F8JXC0_STREN|nr:MULTISPECIES: hypothetical protein [Streptomycetaceae]AEW94593.1 hypothetical protein SCATT_22220 [Streptantibioticus cattleyicolor NRRL 8057 = DSM 46488]MYS59231.1 hypothetical protein [Streptomyces sp. SID5468]CCB74950.1 protein of unknown function [Streptantibioticus cattleyicolor NRRL 8057 = DSM 46488]
MALEGRFEYPAHQLPMEAYRDWRLCQVVGPPDTWMDLPAERLDWILAVDNAVAEARANKEREAASG